MKNAEKLRKTSITRSDSAQVTHSLGWEHPHSDRVDRRRGSSCCATYLLDDNLLSTQVVDVRLGWTTRARLATRVELVAAGSSWQRGGYWTYFFTRLGWWSATRSSGLAALPSTSSFTHIFHVRTLIEPIHFLLRSSLNPLFHGAILHLIWISFRSSIYSKK